MSKKSLFNEDSEDEGKVELKTNENYAKVYNEFRKKELIQKLKDKGLEEESSSDDDLSTDEEVENPEFDKEFLKTISYLVKKDPQKYKETHKFFEKVKPVEETIREKIQRKEKAEKPVTIKDYKRELLLKHGAEFVEEDVEEPKRAESPTYAEEQEKLKLEFKKVLQNSDESDSEDLLQKRSKSKEELEKEESDYLAWLAGQKEALPDDEAVKQLKPLKEFWNSDKLSKEDQFLRDYILNKRYLDKSGDVPTYDEIVGTLEDEEELEKQEEFEHKFNYRFEEPDQEFLKRYPRTISDSVRAVDNKRKEKRKERQERKQLEKQQRKKELDELNRLKKQELEEKIEKLKLVAQCEKFALKEEDLESEFDPDEHDRRMKEAFDDDYYQINEGDQKPEFPDIDHELDIEDWDNYQPDNNVDGDYQEYQNAPHCEDDDFIMDADYNPQLAKKQLQDELIENTKSRRKKKKRLSILAEKIKEKKPTFDPNEKSYEEYLDEYYKLDYEDIIDNMPCRFKYTETVPNDFGLSIEEILMATNKELNQWASLKKTMQKRPTEAEMSDYYKYQKRASNLELKKRIFKSIYGEQEDKELDENIKQEVDIVKPEENQKIVDVGEVIQPEAKKKKKEKKRKSSIALDSKASTESNASETEKPPKKRKAESVNNQNPSKKLKGQPGSFVHKTPFNKNQQSNKKNNFKSSGDKGPKKPFKPNQNGKPLVKNQKGPKLQLGLKGNSSVPPEQQISESRLRAFGIRPKIFYNRLKYGSKQNESNAQGQLKPQNKSKFVKNEKKFKKKGVKPAKSDVKT